MVLTLAALLCVVRAPVPADPADPAVVNAAAAITIAVLPTTSATLAPDEAALLTQLLAIRVERGGYDVIEAKECAVPACLAQTAASSNADAVFLAEHGKLGSADVLTVHLFDVTAGRSYRDAVTASERGALADALGPVVDAMIGRVTKSLPPLRQPSVRAKLDQMRIAIREDAGGWWFVDGTGRALTENEFVRRYRSETQRRNLDDAEIDREPDITAWALTAGGIATGVGSLGLTLYFAATPEGQALANASDDAWVIIPALGLSVGLGLSIYGLIELSESSVNDGNELDHVLDIEQGRAAAAAYNDALLNRLSREAQTANDSVGR